MTGEKGGEFSEKEDGRKQREHEVYRSVHMSEPEFPR